METLYRGSMKNKPLAEGFMEKNAFRIFFFWEKTYSIFLGIGLLSFMKIHHFRGYDWVQIIYRYFFEENTYCRFILKKKPRSSTESRPHTNILRQENLLEPFQGGNTLQKILKWSSTDGKFFTHLLRTLVGLLWGETLWKDFQIEKPLQKTL